jgi:hypothetical protein
MIFMTPPHNRHLKNSRSISPGNGSSLSVEIAQARLAKLGKQHIDDLGNALIHAQRRVRPAKIGARPAGRDQSDLIALVPRSSVTGDKAGSAPGIKGIAMFDLPVATTGIAISVMWHPRMDADAGHRGLRWLALSVCRKNS